MSLISKSHQCPYRDSPHENLAYAIYTNGNWCFSCNKGKLADRSFIGSGIEQQIITPRQDIIFPFTATEDLREFSNETLAWLYNFYVFKDIIRKNHIHYVPCSYFRTASGVSYEGESLIFPIIIDNEIVAYQQRFFPNKQFYSNRTHQHIFDCGNHDTGCVVLVEDFISAIRVGELQNCIWLVGTSLTKNMCKYILKNYSHIKVWMDGDEPGQKASAQIIKVLCAESSNMHRKYAFSVYEPFKIESIVTENDPKCYSRTELRGVLYGS